MLEAPRRVALRVEGPPTEEGASEEDGGGGGGGGGGGDEVKDGAAIGPCNEGALLSLMCTAEGGKPTPKVRKKGKKLSMHFYIRYKQETEKIASGCFFFNHCPGAYDFL